MKSSNTPLKSRAVKLLPDHILYTSLALLCVLVSASCADDIEPNPQRQDAVPTQDDVLEPIAFTDQNYDVALNGETSISALRAKIDPEAFVWHGFSPENPYPVEGDCEPERFGTQRPVSVSSLPTTVRGVVTLYPRYFMKPSICGSDERYYGSFFIQDASGGMLVLRDSRTAGFTFGDVIEFEVNGLMKLFDYDAILSIDNIRVVTDEYAMPDGKVPIYTELVNRPFSAGDQGKVIRIQGVVSQGATNNNFNEMRLRSEDGTVEWFVSLDREVGQRNPDWNVGDRLEVTGPVLNSFGRKIIVMSYGQVRKLDE